MDLQLDWNPITNAIMEVYIHDSVESYSQGTCVKHLNFFRTLISTICFVFSNLCLIRIVPWPCTLFLPGFWLCRYSGQFSVFFDWVQSSECAHPLCVCLLCSMNNRGQRRWRAFVVMSLIDNLVLQIGTLCGFLYYLLRKQQWRGIFCFVREGTLFLKIWTWSVCKPYYTLWLVLGAPYFLSRHETVCDCHWRYPPERFGQSNKLIQESPKGGNQDMASCRGSVQRWFRQKNRFC